MGASKHCTKFPSLYSCFLYLRETFDGLKSLGSALVGGGHGEAASIGEHVDRTVEIRDNVYQSWEATEQQLLQGHQLFILSLIHISEPTRPY